MTRITKRGEGAWRNHSPCRGSHAVRVAWVMFVGVCLATSSALAQEGGSLPRGKSTAKPNVNCAADRPDSESAGIGYRADGEPAPTAAPRRSGSERAGSESAPPAASTDKGSEERANGEPAPTAAPRRSGSERAGSEPAPPAAPRQSGDIETRRDPSPPVAGVKMGLVDPEGAVLARARQLFEEGEALMAQEEWEAAAAVFGQVLSIHATPGVHYHVGYALEKAGKLLEARRSYLEAGRLVLSDPTPGVERRLPRSLARVESLLARLFVGGTPDSARIQVDGHVRPMSSSTWLRPGTYTVTVSAPAYETRKIEVFLNVGETKQIEIDLDRAGQSAFQEMRSLPRNWPQQVSGWDSKLDREASPGEQMEPYQGETSGRRSRAGNVLFWTALSVSVAGLGVGTTGGAILSQASSRYQDTRSRIERSYGEDARCKEANGELGQLCSDLEEATSHRITGVGLVVGGASAGVVALTGALLSRFLRKKTSRSGVARSSLVPQWASPTPHWASLVPQWAPGRGMLSFRSRF